MKRLPRTLLSLVIAAASATGGHATSLLNYVGECVPFARAASGIQIYGNAWTWWEQADGKYERTHKPKEGAVIVFAKTARLPMGHVAVVSRVVEKRVVMLTHANWSRQNGERGHAEQDVTLFDVSPRNDWSDVKVWYKDVDGLGGGVYPVYGFIYGHTHAAPELTSRNPDYVGALIDAYVPVSGKPIAR
ncbi:surface antigen [Sphingomonas sp. PP-F2F-G114-C0414]|uniref:CHAP domain-containing protein n=1 Tax=unclassified Sphingomonas TaxID=196159 RepID=UPI000EF8581A|nr:MULTISPECIES: CHAP domain-containing protein [unclassified Sphingomonas]RMB36087.1 surface antigen [Sphingomonas sp. PP-F2F-G114-C0414]TCP67944.1 surface antigen [Sphingomonas sp. PP-CE-1G-424]